MVQSFSKIQLCSLDPNVQMTDTERTKCKAMQGTTNPCLGYYSNMCAIVGGTPREDACSKQRFCKNPFMLFSQQCTQDSDCATSNINKKPFDANGIPVADVGWLMQRPCCDSLKANIEQICEGVTEAIKEVMRPLNSAGFFASIPPLARVRACRFRVGVGEWVCRWVGGWVGGWVTYVGWFVMWRGEWSSQQPRHHKHLNSNHFLCLALCKGVGQCLGLEPSSLWLCTRMSRWREHPDALHTPQCLALGEFSPKALIS
jgi:hypothetical protein